MGTDLTGMIRGLQQARDRGMAGARRGVGQLAAEVLTMAQANAPGKSGALKASGEVGELVVDGDQITQAVRFAAPYAAEVHEDLAAHHDTGQAKYLELAVSELAPRAGGIIGGKVSEALGS